MDGGGEVPRVVGRALHDGRRLNIPVRYIYWVILLSFVNNAITVSSTTAQMTVVVILLALVGLLTLRYQRRVDRGEYGEDGHLEEGDERYVAFPLSFIGACIVSWFVFLMGTEVIILFVGIIMMCYHIIMNTF